MAEDLSIVVGSKEEKYRTLIPQLKALCEGEPNRVANLANVAAAIKQTFDYYWVGFYLVDKKSDNDELVLAPFQGPIACTRIKKGRGVCGTAWEKAETILVDNVDEFPGHIACSSLSKSEIVVPLIKNNEVIGVFDLDHDHVKAFDEVDHKYLNEICSWLASII
ncbi:GAF domain-containing protein [Brumimicrobium glaciale]|jgi:GAF domain-containing protein|uniref:GAF domain-containing protein n=1 Tax=Brumimicrobium glaciale TaxID=200475 RepID=A0A4V1WFQ9_9FLAO|nr:GAF domain-containing protein [Brumimicrobium glaciale]RYM34056.1 GAF domain-containing protein [Brumimicrobium glaciale]